MTRLPAGIKQLVVAAALLLLGGGGACAGVWKRPAVVAPSRTAAGDGRQVNVLAIGDWGDDTRAQGRVAEGMASFADERLRGRLDGVLALGDNFYVTLTGTGDPKFDRLFERMFDPKRLNVPFYALLGNHDYSGGREDRVELQYAKERPNSRWKMPGRWYRVELPSADDPLVTFIMLDSNYLFLSTEEWRAQADWLRGELAKPRTARWLVVCAHHPLYSNGGHGDDERLRREWGPLLAQHHVDFYLSAHDHNLQHLRIPGLATTFVISGGGGATTYEIVRADRGPFARQMHGFAHLRFGERSADVHLLDTRGRPVHAFSTTPLRRDEARDEGPTTVPTSAAVAPTSQRVR